MKLLWLCNTYTPECCNEFRLQKAIWGGWLFYLSSELSKSDGNTLYYVFISEELKQEKEIVINNVHYIGLPKNKGDYTVQLKEYEFYFNKKIKEIVPDIIHVWGTEYIHSLAMTNVCKNNGLLDKLIVSIQGFISSYAQHYLSSDISNVKRTFADFLLNDSLKKQKNDFIERGRYELEAISKCRNVIGRTDYDKACVYIANKNARYFYCNEILRNEFYRGDKWSFDKCGKHTILISNGSYPIKGLHIFLKALAIVVKTYKDVKVKICGNNIIPNARWKYTSYQKVLADIIEENKLEDHIYFIGPQDVNQMYDNYLNTNVFVSPSLIENSSNAIGEAMMVGTPIIASNVGGTPSLLRDKKDGLLYQYDAPYMLAYYIMEIFENENLSKSLSNNCFNRASVLYDRNKNYQTIVDIYNIVNKEVI